MDQLTPYWDPANQQFQGPGNVPAGSSSMLSDSWNPIRHSFNGSQVGNAAAATIPLGWAARPGVIKLASLGVTVAATGNDTATIDLKRNGTSILNAGAFTIDNTIAAATVQTPALAAAQINVQPGDEFTLVITATHNTGTLPTGLVASISIDQLPVTGDTIPLGHVARAGLIKAAMASVPVLPGGNDTYSIDIKKNNVSVLTGGIALSSSSTAKTAVAGTLASPPVAVAVNDYLEAVITYTHGTGSPAPQGIVAAVQIIQN